MTEEEMESKSEQASELPDDATISARFRGAVYYWSNRNKFILEMRKTLAGLNDIKAPVSSQYKVQTLHSYSLAAALNEKLSRYTLTPNIQVIPDELWDDEDTQKSGTLEKGINTAIYNIELMADGDVWSRVILDAHLIDEGVEKWLNASKNKWAALVDNDSKVQAGEVENKFPVGSSARENFKKRLGVPITKTYVPLEYFYPIYEGADLVESFEVESRSLRWVLDFPHFDKSKLDTLPEPGPDGGIKQQVNIVQYVNSTTHAYYLAGPSNDYSTGGGSGNKWPTINPNTSMFSGNLTYLYSYEHGLGRSIYNCVAGRFGGWKTNNNRIEAVGRGLLELSQAQDNILSQVFTNTRAKYWPTLNFKIDPDKRGYGPGSSKPNAPTIKEGEPLVTFIGEEVGPIFDASDDPMTMWIYDKTEAQFSKIAGSSVLYGEKSPGVDTGYHQALQTTAAESLDEKLEQHISMGAVQGATIMLLYVKCIGETVWVNYKEPDPANKLRKVGKYTSIDPADTYPLPMMDAQVRKPSPIDYGTAMNVGLQASNNREGKGPLLSDETIRGKLLNISNPDEEELTIRVEEQKNKLIETGFLTTKIGEMINIQLANESAPNVTGGMIGQADPALLTAIQQTQPQAAVAGGTDPNLLAQTAETVGLPPGPPSGSPEQANRIGEALAMNGATGASIQ